MDTCCQARLGCLMLTPLPSTMSVMNGLITLMRQSLNSSSSVCFCYYSEMDSGTQNVWFGDNTEMENQEKLPAAVVAM